MRLVQLTFAIAVLAAVPSPATAQFDWVGGLIGRITDLSVSLTVGDVTPTWEGNANETVKAPRGIGVELLLELKPWTRNVGIARDTVIQTPIETVVTRRLRQVTDSITKFKTEVKKTQETKTLAIFELGIGYVENPFTIEAAGFALRGALRELPMITVYGSLQWDVITSVHDLFTDCNHKVDGCGITDVGLSPYFGLRGGLVSLSGTRAIVPLPPDSTGKPSQKVTAIKGGGDAFRGGLVGGIVLGIGLANAFVEAEYGRRRIPAIQWEGIIPETLPMNLEFRKWLFAAGLQLEIGKLAGDK